MTYNHLKLILLAVTALISPVISHAISPDFYPENSVLSSGRWVKVRVDNSGMQQITYDQLRQWGFNDPSAVTVFGFGSAANTRDIVDDKLGGDLPQQPVVYLDDKLVFFGESAARVAFIFNGNGILPTTYVERNAASEYGCYFLTDSQPLYDLNANLIPLTSGGNATDWHLSTGFVEEEIANPNAAGRIYVGHNLGPDEVLEFNFDIPDIYTSSSKSPRLYINPVLFSEQNANRFTLTLPTFTNPDAIVNISITNPSSDPVTSPYISRSNYNISRDVNPDAQSFRVTIARQDPATYPDFAALDHLSFFYHRQNILADRPELVLNYATLEANSAINIAQTDTSTQVWDIEHASCVRPYATQYNTITGLTTITTPTTHNISSVNPYGARIIAFNPAAEHNTVSYVGQIDNQDLHSLQTPDLIIISSNLCYSQALDLADIHRRILGHDVLVVRQQELFNEFSSGVPSQSAYRMFAKMLYDRNPDKLKAVLLFGAGSYDNRALIDNTRQLFEAGALLLTYGTNDLSLMGTTSRSFSADAYYGMLDDAFKGSTMTEQFMTINVGRLPVSSQAEASDAVEKIRQYLSSVPTVDVKHRVILLSDSGNQNSHMSSSEKIADELYSANPGFTIIKAYDAIYPWTSNTGKILREHLINSLQAGVGFFNYTGHGDPTSLSGRTLWNTSLALQTDYDFYPIVVVASCDTYNFDRSSNNLGHIMTLKPNGGAIAYIGAGRTVYETMNQRIDQQISRAYAEAPEGSYTGDIFRIGRNSTIAYSYDANLNYNTLCYNFCGDPLLPLYAATCNVTLDKVNGTPHSASRRYELTALGENVFEGFVFSNPGFPDATFNGTLIATLYEAPTTVTTHTANNSDIATDIVLDEDKIAEVTTRIENGRFSFTLTPPVVSREGTYNRLTLYAYSDDLKRFSRNYTKALHMSFDNEATPTDTEAPVISELYLNSPEFTDGDMVGSTFYLYATIEPDPSGLKTSVAAIGATTRVVIDGTRTMNVYGTAMTTEADGTIRILMPISSVADGRHSLTLSTSDNIGNSSSRTINFQVLNAPVDASLAISESPARVQATIRLDHTFANQPGGRLVIEDINGNTIRSIVAPTFPYEWDLTDSEGNLVADGVYRAYAILNSGLQYAATPKAEIIVLQKQ